MNEAARALGSIRTERKSAAGRANMQRLNAARTLAACTCGRDPHAATCPVYKRAATRDYRERKRAAASQ